MLKRLIHMMILLLAAATMAMAQGGYVIDEVCRGAQRTYRVEGEQTSTWIWALKDTTGTAIDLSGVSSNKFTDTNSEGETIYGSEINIIWDYDPMQYSLSVEQTSSFGCINHELGTIEVYPAPESDSGDPLAICSNENIQITTASAANYSDLVWTTDGDGTFNDQTILNPTYTPGVNDIANKTATLTLTANGLITGTGCPSAESSVELTIYPVPQLAVNNPNPVCEPETIDLSDTLVLDGSFIPDGSDTTYWTDRNVTSPLTNYDSISTSGTYYIKVEAPGACIKIDSVEVIVNPMPAISITDPDPVCEPTTVDLTNPAIVDGSTPGLNYTYWTDIDTTIAITDPAAIDTSGTYYIKGTNPVTGCLNIKPVKVVINEQPILIITNPDPICENESVDLSSPSIIDGSTIPTGSSFTYWVDVDATIELTNYNAIEIAGTYYIKVEAPGGCFDIKPVEVIVNPLPNLVINDPDPVCEPGTIDISDSDITNGSEAGLDFNYWQDENSTIVLSNYASLSSSGTYYIQATNPTTGCSIIKPVEVTIYPIPNLVTNDPDVVCEPTTIDLSDASVTIGSESNLSFTYWEDRETTVPLTNFNNISASGKYYIKATSTITGCEDIDSVEVLINPVPVLVINTPDEVCEPETIDLTNGDIIDGSTIPPSSTISYWNDAAATSQVSDPEHITETGTYYIKVVAGTDCYDISPVELTINKLPILIITDPDPVCEPQTVDLTASSVTSGSNTDIPLTYWKDEAATIPLANPDVISTSGTYYIQATRNGLCPVIKPVNVIVNTPPELIITDPGEVCEPEFIDLTDLSVTVGSTYSSTAVITYWKDNAATQVLANPDQVTVSGTYYIKVSEATDCFDLKPVNVAVHEQPDLTIINPDAVCDPETVDLTDINITPGLDPSLTKTYWVDASVSTEVIDPAAISVSGTYYINVEDANGCSNMKPVQVIVNKPDQLSFNMETTFCLNSVAPALPSTAQGGITGTWNPATITTDAIGQFDYTFTPTPGQCALPNTVQITITDRIVPEFNPMGPYYQGSASATLPTTSKNGISGSWNQPKVSTNSTGTFEYTFTPAAGQCATDQTLSIQILPPVSAIGNTVNNLCGGESNGSIDLTVSGGSGSFTYNWSNGATSEDISGLPDGNYKVIITDASGAKKELTFTIISEDTSPPVANCYEYYKVNIGANGIYELTQADLDSISQGSYDNCSEILVSVNPNRFDCSQVGQMIEYTLTVTDRSNNSSSCSHYIVVNDLLPPEISCMDTTLYLDVNGEVTLSNPNDLVEVRENCGVDSIIIENDQFNCTHVGTNPVQIIAKDNNGNYSDPCYSNITVLDTIKPIVLTNDYNIVLDNSETYTITSEDIDNGSSDACGIESISLSKSTFTCSDLGANTITVSVTDHSGNVNHGTATINVSFDNPAPTIEDDLVQTIQNRTVTFYPFENDTDPNGTINIRSFTIIVPPENGTVKWQNDSLVYIPHEDFIGIDSLRYSVCDNGIPCEPQCGEALINFIIHKPNLAPVARDTIYSSGCFDINGDLMLNVFDPDSNNIIINTTPILSPTYGTVTIHSDGTFLYEFDPPIMATDRFSYEVCDDHFDSKCDQATVYIRLFIDNDCDNIDDEIDIDDDNDGITDIEEGDLALDSDNDLIPNSLDIDSDNDGIVDNIEGQRTGRHIDPWGIDENENGLDDAYETDGLGITPFDTDGNGYPDYIDPDSDSDGVPDRIEGFDANPTEGFPEITASGLDDDQDGLDNAYDDFVGTYDSSDLSNPFGSKAPLQDFDGDGKPDWRDSDDENDDILTRFEDLNNNGDYTDDDEDNDNLPEYLDFANKCELFIPEGFSPDGDGIHDYFQMLCIKKFTNATLMIFDRLGNMIYKHEHYGNMEYWGSESEAWWDGTMNRHNQESGQMVEPDVYMYIFELGNGTRKRGFVMVSY